MSQTGNSASVICGLTDEQPARERQNHISEGATLYYIFQPKQEELVNEKETVYVKAGCLDNG